MAVPRQGNPLLSSYVLCSCSVMRAYTVQGRTPPHLRVMSAASEAHYTIRRRALWITMSQASYEGMMYPSHSQPGGCTVVGILLTRPRRSGEQCSCGACYALQTQRTDPLSGVLYKARCGADGVLRNIVVYTLAVCLAVSR